MAVNTTQDPVRLMGVSRCRAQGSVVEQLLGMRQDICKFNADAGVRSALLYSDGWLLQWHEGPAKAVEQPWRLPAANFARVSPVRTIHRSVGQHGLVDTLHIAILHCGANDRDLAGRFNRVRRELASGLPAEPAAIWQRLSAPCLAEPAQVGSQARLDVVVVASEYNESVDLIKAVAERFRARVAYQRFADADIRSGDVGAAYLDLGGEGRIIRVHALSRRALANSMVRLSLRNAQCVVLLLGTRSHPAAILASSVATILNTIPIQPSMNLICPSLAISAHAAELLKGLPGIHVNEVRAGVTRRESVDALLSVIGIGRQIQE
jgi:hypothetical protein